MHGQQNIKSSIMSNSLMMETVRKTKEREKVAVEEK